VNICMITSSYPRHEGDGAGSYVRGLAEALAIGGAAVYVVAPYDPRLSEMMDTHGVSVQRFKYAPTRGLHVAGHGTALELDMRLRWFVPFLVPGFVVAAIVSAVALHRRVGFDVIHAHWAVPGGAIGAIVAHIIERPLVITLHGSDVYVVEHSKVCAVAARAAFRKAGRVTAVCDDLRRRAERIGLDPERSLVVPCGVDLVRFGRGNGLRMRERLGLNAQVPVLGALGRLVHKKGFADLIVAMPMILAAVPDAHCVIGGSGDLGPALAQLAGDLGVAHRVLLPGHIDWREVPDFLAMVDVMAIPSVVDPSGNVDGLPNVVPEAMAAGCPIVASDLAGLRDVIDDCNTGRLVPPGRPQLLAEAIVGLLRDPGLRHRLGQAARQNAAARYDWALIAGCMQEIYYTAIRLAGSRQPR